MNRENLEFYVIPSNVEMNNIIGYNSSRNGKIVSTLNEIKVNKIPNGYSIIYNSDDINNIDTNVLGNNIIKLFMKNLPGKHIDIKLFYLYEITDEDGDIENIINISCVNALLKMELKFNKLPDDESIPFKYIRTSNMINIIDIISNSYQELDNEKDNIKNNNSVGIDAYFESFGISDFNDEDDDEDDDYDEDSVSLLNSHIKDKKRRSKKHQSSRIMHNAKNAKRSYNRHGVLITDKESRKRDEKIIKEFLKDFFPGDSEWKKNFRHDVLKRWMKMYSVTKRDLKELEKTHRKVKNNKRNNVNNEKTLDFTRRLFNVPMDRWSDPNR